MLTGKSSVYQDITEAIALLVSETKGDENSLQGTVVWSHLGLFRFYYRGPAEGWHRS